MSPGASEAPGGPFGPRIALLALLLLLAGAVGGVPYLPTHDGPQHVFTSHAATHFEAAGRGWAHWLEPNVPPTNQGFNALFAPFDAWLPWPVALRIALVLGVLLWAGGAAALVRTLSPARAWLALPLAAVACQWALYMGFFSFHAASGLGLWVLALALRHPLPTPANRVALALLLLAQAAMHVVAAGLTGIVLLVLAASRAPAGGRLRALAATAAAGLPAAAVALAVMRVGLSTLGDLNEGLAVESVSLARGPWWILGRCFAAGPAWRAWALPVLAAAAAALALARARRGLSAEDRALALAGAALLLLALALPLHLRAWDFFSVRLLPLGSVALVATLPLERLRTPAWRGAASAGLALWAFAAGGWAWQHHREAYARIAPALAGLDAPLVRDGLRLPVVMDAYLGQPPDAEAEVPFVVPALNLGALYAASQGGTVPYSFTVNPVLHYLLRDDDAWAKVPGAVDRRYAIDLARSKLAASPEFRRAVLAYVASRATGYQDVILWGREADVAQLREMGFELDFAEGGLAIARFAGCPLVVRVEGAAPDTALTMGWYPSGEVTHRYPVARGELGPDGASRLRVHQSCGAVWIGVAGDEAACAGADASGRMLVESTRGTPEVTCRLVPQDAVAAR